jgi:hypothetical protein
VIAAGALVACALASGGYLGVDAVARPEGLMVWRVLPGPLDGNILESSTLARGDLIVSIDGAPVTIEAWEGLAGRSIGETVRIGFRQGSPRGWRGAPDSKGAEREVEIRVADASIWRGLLGRAELPPLPTGHRDENELRRSMTEARAALGPEARARADRLVTCLSTIADPWRDPSTPRMLRALMADPGVSEETVRSAVPTESDCSATPFRAAAATVVSLAGQPDAKLPEAHGVFKVAHADAGIWYLDFLLNGARARFDQWVTPEQAKDDGLRPLVVERIDDLLVRGPTAARSMRALAHIPSLTPLQAAELIAHFDVELELARELAQSTDTVELPDALRGAVEGEILAASEIPEIGWAVVGGRKPNRYDLGRIAAVLDLGGDDRYEWRQGPASHRLVVDLSGNDAHVEGEGASIGPAGCIGGISVIDDRSGDDRYEGGALTAGSVLGLSMLVDRRGNDTYRAGPWSLGASAGGAAVVMDLAGSDRIEAEGMGIGLGGPCGVGIFLDAAGDDVADLGTRPSVYGVAGQHAGLGMGCGFGFRFAAAGGVGAYLDLSGRDVRRSGEFSQGCGYFLGVGILFDGAGDDVSTADRYGIGSAAHQAAGIAIDLAGNDVFTGRTAAHLGAAWDQSLGVFIDAGGDDSYRVHDLSIGAASQQAFGFAIDRSGSDLYEALRNTLGGAADNDYHFERTGLGSLACFVDLGGTDRYPPDRADDSVTISGESATAELKQRDGVFIDRTAASAPK